MIFHGFLGSLYNRYQWHQMHNFGVKKFRSCIPLPLPKPSSNLTHTYRTSEPMMVLTTAHHQLLCVYSLQSLWDHPTAHLLQVQLKRIKRTNNRKTGVECFHFFFYLYNKFRADASIPLVMGKYIIYILVAIHHSNRTTACWITGTFFCDWKRTLIRMQLSQPARANGLDQRIWTLLLG